MGAQSTDLGQWITINSNVTVRKLTRPQLRQRSVVMLTLFSRSTADEIIETLGLAQELRVFFIECGIIYFLFGYPSHIPLFYSKCVFSIHTLFIV